MTAEEFRIAALKLPGAVESAHMNHPDFRVNGKIFASLGAPNECWGMVKLTPEQQHSFIERAPGVFKPCSGAWGERGCTNVHLAAAKKNILSAALNAAFKNLTSKTFLKGLKGPTAATRGKGRIPTLQRTADAPRPQRVPAPMDIGTATDAALTSHPLRTGTARAPTSQRRDAPRRKRPTAE